MGSLESGRRFGAWAARVALLVALVLAFGPIPAIFVFIVICFVGEWALRRWKGMP